MRHPYLSAALGLGYAAFFGLTSPITHSWVRHQAWFPRVPAPVTAAPGSTPTPQVPSGPYTGEASSPMEVSPEKLEQCRAQLETLGPRLSSATGEGKEPKLESTAADACCPSSGLQYRLLQSNPRFVLYCSGHVHGETDLFWDSATGEVGQQWPTSEGLDSAQQTELLWLRKQAAMMDGDYSQALEFCRELERLGITNTLMDVSKCQLYLEQPEAALETCEKALQQEMTNKPPDPASLLSLRLSIWLELQRYAEVLSQTDPVVAGGGGDRDTHVNRVMALLQLNRSKEAASELESITDYPLFQSYAQLALKNYPECRKQVERNLSEAGWQGDYTGNCVVVGVIAGWLEGEPTADTQKRLRDALRDSPKFWPYPLLRYLNGEVAEADLLKLAAGNLSRTIEAKFTVGMNLLAHRREEGRARDMLRSFSSHGEFFETFAAKQFLP